MIFNKIQGNQFTPVVSENEWHCRYPKVDREYVWSYPLIHNKATFDVRKIFEKSDIPIVSTDTVVYIHVPACLFRCSMCPFYVELVKSRDELLGYADRVIKELKMYANNHLLDKLNLKTIYFGGGTASLLYPKDIGRIIESIKDLIPSKSEIEITVEGHPNVVDYDYLAELKEVGVNRVSFGIQSFNKHSLKSLGLRQTPEKNKETLENAVKLGFKTVSADLLYRMPGQSLDDLMEELEEFLSYGITSLSTYSLELSVRESVLQNLQPSEIVDQEMFYAINQKMNKLGWNHTAQPEYSHPDHIQQETIVTWMAPQGQTIGLGAGACSSFNNSNYYNVHNMEEYMRVVDSGCLPVLDGQNFTLEDAMSRYAVLGTRCFNIVGAPFKEAFGVELQDIFGQEIRLLKDQGLIEMKNNNIVVSSKGKYYIDNISKTFYTLGNRCRLQPWGEKMKDEIAKSYYNTTSNIMQAFNE